MRGIFAAVLVLAPSALFAAPSITGFTGSLTQGSTITLTGSFSAVATTDTVFDDFESGSFHPGWNSHNDLTIVSLSESTNPYSAKSAYLNFTDAANHGQLQGGVPHRDVYNSYRVKISSNWDWGTTGYTGTNKFLSNIKPCRAGNASNTINDFFLQLQLTGDTGAYAGVEGVTGWDAQIYGSLTKHSYSSGTWHRLDCLNHDSDADGTTANGWFKAYFDGRLAFSTMNIITQDEGVDNPKIAFDVGFPNAWGSQEDGGGGVDPSDDAPNEYWLDDALVQGTFARIEISTCAASYTACPRVPQWVTVMTGTTAKFIVNLNGIPAGKTVYAWPSDANDAQGASFPLNSVAVSVSGNVRISGNVRMGE